MVVSSPLFEEFLDTSWRAPVEIQVGSQKTPHPGGEGAVDGNMISRFQVMLVEAASAGNDLAPLG